MTSLLAQFPPSWTEEILPLFLLPILLIFFALIAYGTGMAAMKARRKPMGKFVGMILVLIASAVSAPLFWKYLTASDIQRDLEMPGRRWMIGHIGPFAMSVLILGILVTEYIIARQRAKYD
ncbi:MAG: hypothetical protein SNJ74_12175 [Fimbriimonadaceae bacterium]